MAGENGGELAGLFGEMLMGGLEAMAEGREGRGGKREKRHAGFEILGEMAAHQSQEMQEYFKSGAPYGPTQEGMARWLSERAAASVAAVAERLVEAAAAPAQVAQHARNSVADSQRIRSFAEHENIRSFAENEHIRSFAESDRFV